MNTRDTPRRRSFAGVTLTELLSVLAILAFLVVVLFPVFQHRSRPLGAVRDSSGKPIAGATLHFRDQTGRVVATITSDGNGGFRRDGLDSLSHDAVDGFEPSYITHRSGYSDVYVFTPIAAQIAAFRDEAGKPVSGLDVALGPDHHTWQHDAPEPFEQVTDKNGILHIGHARNGGRFEFQSRNPRYIVERFPVTDEGFTIRYAVTVAAPATITGCLRDEVGRPLQGYKAFATISPDTERFDRWYADNPLTGPTGRFRITSLRPRTYYVSAAPAEGYHAVAPAQCVTVAGGRNTEVSLRADPVDQEHHAH